MTTTGIFVSHPDAIREALRIETAKRCNIGQHRIGCPHRPASPWMARAIAGTLPASDRTGLIRVNR